MTINLKLIALITPVFVSFFWFIILVLRNRSVRQPGFYIALLMLVLFLLFLSIIPFYVDNLRLFRLLDPVFMFSSTLIFPVVYFYIRLVAKRKPVRRKDLVHIMFPVLFLFTSAVLHGILTEDEEFKYANHMVEHELSSTALKFIDLLNIAVKVFMAVQVVFYFYLCHDIIRQYRSAIKDYFSNLESYFFSWIYFFYFSYSGASAAGIFLLLIGNPGLDNSRDNLLIISFFSLSILFFAIAYIANNQRYIENGHFFEGDPEDGSNGSGSQNAEIVKRPDLKEKFLSYFESEKPYLDPNLKITDVSRQLNSNRTYISNLIKEEFDFNFLGYVNSCRVREAIGLFMDRKQDHYSIRSISETVGFNNYNSFVRAFRKETGMTPGRYRMMC